MGSIIILKKIHLLKKNFKKMVIEMLLNDDIQLFFGQMILNFQKEINVITYNIEIKKKIEIISFEQNFNKI
jgi:hypothetical protein